MRLYSAPRTRALRVAWLLEELAHPYDLQQVTFKTTSNAFFIQDTPTGKIPTLEDNDVVLAESGAILQYLLTRYGDGRLQPPGVDATYADYLQWFHFAESTAFSPIGVYVWLTVYREDAAEHAQLVSDAHRRVLATLAPVNERLSQVPHLAGAEFTAADIMMGFTLLAAQGLGLLDEAPQAQAYLQRLTARPAFQAAAEKVGGFT